MSPPRFAGRRDDAVAHAPLLAWLLVAGALVIFAWRCVEHGGYFAEDAYISFRFATNLATGEGLVWNPGGERVEGYTSPLHVVILAAGIAAGLGAPATAVAVGLLAVLGLVALFVAIIRREVGTFTIAAALALAFYLVDARLAVHATAGLDTVMAMFLLATSFFASLRVVEQPGVQRAIALSAINLLCLLGRPDAAPYIAMQSAVLLVAGLVRWRRSGDRQLLAWVVVSVSVLGAVGAGYLALKYAYFGYLLPNPFYIKSNNVTSLDGLGSVINFIKRLLPLAPLVLALLLMDRARMAEWLSRPHSWVKLGLLVLPPAAFLAFFTTVLPEVNYLNRFEYAAYFFVVVTLGLALSIGGVLERVEAWLSRVLPPAGVRATTALTLVGLAASAVVATRIYFPWFELVETRYYRPIGEALAASGLGPRASLVFDSAGVVPYVSGFTHIDPVGLTDNVLSGRQPISAWQREQYIWSQRPDVYVGPELPASMGARSCSDEPLIGLDFVQDVLLSPDRFRISKGYWKAFGSLSSEDRCELMHYRMRELRDRYDYLGEVPFPVPSPPGYTTFVYVRSDSPHRRDLRAGLDRLFANGPGLLGPPRQLSRATNPPADRQ